MRVWQSLGVCKNVRLTKDDESLGGGKNRLRGRKYTEDVWRRVTLGDFLDGRVG